MKESKNDYKIEHIEKPSGITHSPYNMIPYLPDIQLFFDSTDILPFSLTTRISANNQQFLKVIEKETCMKESKNNKVIQVANIADDKENGFKNPQRGRVYSAQGISPVVECCQGGDRQPKIIE